MITYYFVKTMIFKFKILQNVHSLEENFNYEGFLCRFGNLKVNPNIIENFQLLKPSLVSINQAWRLINQV